MLPVNIGGHTAYQNTFVSEFLKLYPNPFAVPKSTWDPKEINVILEMRYLPEEYRERLIGYLRCLRDDMKK